MLLTQPGLPFVYADELIPVDAGNDAVTALVEIVVTLELARCTMGTYYRHLLRVTGKPKAQKTAARKLCCYLHFMLRGGWTHGEWLQRKDVLGASLTRAVR